MSSKGKKSRRRSRYEISIAAIRRAYTYIIIIEEKIRGKILLVCILFLD